MRSVPALWLPPSVRIPLRCSVRLPGTTVSPDICTVTTWLKRPVGVAHPVSGGFVRYRKTSPLVSKSGCGAIPSRPISPPGHTGTVVSVVAVPFCRSFSAPPFSVTSSLPSGRKAIAVGIVSPDATTSSLKLAGGAAAAGAAVSRKTAAATEAARNRLRTENPLPPGSGNRPGLERLRLAYTTDRAPLTLGAARRSRRRGEPDGRRDRQGLHSRRRDRGPG